ncbi:hypothetical protein [Parasphingorhabdus sp.]|uniref:hypothetical protein n=1 Tax=Parasphingorhabdus sp. TaxID=2709688 RepID=UPI003A94670C
MIIIIIVNSATLFVIKIASASRNGGADHSRTHELQTQKSPEQSLAPGLLFAI